MGTAELILIAVGLSMDAFAVAVCKGLCMPKLNLKQGTVIALFFGAAQAIMPVIGWLLGSQFEKYISSFDHWIAFVLLAFIGGKMIYEAVKDRDGDDSCELVRLDLRELLILAVATSIDALAVGITLAFLRVSIVSSALTIGAITFALALAGVAIGNRFGAKYKTKAEILGGIVLILIGAKILLEHLGILVL